MKRLDLILAVLGALMLALSRLPLHLGWLVFIAWIPYLYIFERGVEKPSHMLQIGFVTALIYDLILFYWFAMVTLPGLIGIVLLYSLVYFLMFSAIQRIFRSLPSLGYVGFVAFLITFEYVQNFGETRFPWFNQAYSLADYTVLQQFADIGGVTGLSVLILVVNALLYNLFSGSLIRKLSARNRQKELPYNGKLRWGVLSVFALIFIGWLGYGILCLQSMKLEQHDAGIFVMQPSIDQEVKWDEAQYSKSMEIFKDLTTQAAADSAKLVIWPEGAVTQYLKLSNQAQTDLRSIIATTRVEIFTGFPDCQPAPAGHVTNMLYYNSASLFKRNDFNQEVYNKNILVPVAERMLWLKQFPFMWKLQFGQANWEFGKELRFYKSGNFIFSPSICYELAFPDIFHRMAIPKDPVSKAYKKCDYLVNITNDAWFGTSYGPWLHATMTRFRAIENRIQIYRSANTGISMIVDPRGRILTKTKLFERTNISAPLYTTPKIPLIRKIYRYPLLIVGLALVLIIVALIKKTERLV